MKIDFFSFFFFQKEESLEIRNFQRSFRNFNKTLTRRIFFLVDHLKFPLFLSARCLEVFNERFCAHFCAKFLSAQNISLSEEINKIKILWISKLRLVLFMFANCSLNRWFPAHLHFCVIKNKNKNTSWWKPFHRKRKWWSDTQLFLRLLARLTSALELLVVICSPCTKGHHDTVNESNRR